MADRKSAMGKGDAKRLSWRRVGICLAIIFVALWLVYPLAMHVVAWDMARREAHDASASIVPRGLPNTRVADLKDGEEVSTFGYVIDVPWKVLKRSDWKTGSRLTFGNGTEVAIFDVKGDAVGLNTLKKSTPSEAAAFRSLYGKLATGSRYEWLQAELDASPSDVSFWRSSNSNVRAWVFMMQKNADMQKAKVVYSVAAGGMHGFQIGDPGQPVSPVMLRLFDAKDREIWMILRPAQNGTGFTQEQINAMMASMRPAE
jgi:hypothetical protein